MNSHARVQELLPWFVNGSLNEGEQSLVDAHLEECPECRISVEELVAVAAKFSASDPFDLAWRSDAVCSFMDQLPPKPGVVSESAWLRPTMAVFGALAIAAVLLVGLPRTDAFRTLSFGEHVRDAPPVVQVVFGSDTTEKTIRDILLEDGNRVIGGPTQQGVYRVALGTSEDADVFIARLKHNPNVIFVTEEK